jgi:hypothetical protein
MKVFLLIFINMILLKDLLEEQSMGGMTSPANYAKHSVAGAAAIDPHTALQTAAFVSMFIPGIGLLVSAGIQLGDAALYWHEGNRYESGLATAFALIPGIGGTISKLPAVKKLTAKGMAALGQKLATSKNPVLNNLETAVIRDMNKYKDVLKRDMDAYFKARAANVARQTTKQQLRKPTMRVLNSIGKGTVKASVIGSKFYATYKTWDIATQQAEKAWNDLYVRMGLDKLDDVDASRNLLQTMIAADKATQRDATNINMYGK